MSQAPSLQFSAGPSFGKAPPVGLKPLSMGSRVGSVSVKREWNEANWKVDVLQKELLKIMETRDSNEKCEVNRCGDDSKAPLDDVKEELQISRDKTASRKTELLATGTGETSTLQR